MTEPRPLPENEIVALERKIRESIRVYAVELLGPMAQGPATALSGLAQIVESHAALEAALSAAQEALRDDAAGRPFAELLDAAAHVMELAGGGPLADCLRGKADDVRQVGSIVPQGAELRLRDELVAAQEALRRYGKHDRERCIWGRPPVIWAGPRPDCTCDFDAARDAVLAGSVVPPEAAPAPGYTKLIDAMEKPRKRTRIAAPEAAPAPEGEQT